MYVFMYNQKLYMALGMKQKGWSQDLLLITHSLSPILSAKDQKEVAVIFPQMEMTDGERFNIMQTLSWEFLMALQETKN